MRCSYLYIKQIEKKSLILNKPNIEECDGKENLMQKI
jgi:hypothetical protein